MRLPLLTIAPAVVDLLGGPAATRALFADAGGLYWCTVCGRISPLTPEAPAVVIVVVFGRGTRPPAVRFAHTGCSDSGIRVADEPIHVNLETIWPGKAWLRPEPSDPRAVILIGPRYAATDMTPGGDTVNRLTTGLLADGFALLTYADASLPAVGGLTIRIGPGNHVAVREGYRGTIYDAPLRLPAEWADVATASGRVGLLVVIGMHLDNEHRDPLSDLLAAIGNGAAVGATGQLTFDVANDLAAVLPPARFAAVPGAAPPGWRQSADNNQRPH